GEGKVTESGGPDVIRSTAIADYATGIAIAWGVSAALFHRERTGEGQLIESTLLNTALAFQGSTVFDLPAADAMVHQKMEAINQAKEQGVPYAELVKMHNPQ